MLAGTAASADRRSANDNDSSAIAAGNSASGGQGLFSIKDGTVEYNIVGGTAVVNIGTVTPTAASGAAVSTGNSFGTAFGGAASAGADLATGILKPGLMVMAPASPVPISASTAPRWPIPSCSPTTAAAISPSPSATGSTE
jgi:hypothetical protein